MRHLPPLAPFLGQEQELIAEDVEAEAQEAVDAEIAAEREAVASQEDGMEAAAAVMAEAERAVEAAATARATRQEQRGRLVDSQREAELETAQVLGEIGKAQQKLRVVQGAMREEAGKGVGDGGSAITTIVGESLGGIFVNKMLTIVVRPLLFC